MHLRFKLFVLGTNLGPKQDSRLMFYPFYFVLLPADVQTLCPRHTPQSVGLSQR